MIAQGEVGGLAQARDVVRGSFKVREYGVEAREEWAAAYQRFKTI